MVSYKLINGPINKSSFLNKKYLGITEFISQKFKMKNTGMTIFNKRSATYNSSAVKISIKEYHY